MKEANKAQKKRHNCCQEDSALRGRKKFYPYGKQSAKGQKIKSRINFIQNYGNFRDNRYHFYPV